LPKAAIHPKIEGEIGHGPLAQLAEQLTLNQQVQRSTRWRLTNSFGEEANKNLTTLSKIV
jgi:hypothetical protein